MKGTWGLYDKKYICKRIHTHIQTHLCDSVYMHKIKKDQKRVMPVMDEVGTGSWGQTGRQTSHCIFL